MALALAVAFVGCAEEGRPSDAALHGLGECDPTWRAQSTGFTECETPCTSFHDYTSMDASVCRTTTSVGGNGCDADTAFEYKGVQGCCKANGARVVFAECE